MYNTHIPPPKPQTSDMMTRIAGLLVCTITAGLMFVPGMLHIHGVLTGPMSSNLTLLALMVFLLFGTRGVWAVLTGTWLKLRLPEIE